MKSILIFLLTTIINLFLNFIQSLFISGGLSKWCGAGGWRLGFLAVPNGMKNFMNSLKSLASESYSTVNTPTQFAAVEAYKGNYEDYKLKVKSILKVSRKLCLQ